MSEFARSLQRVLVTEGGYVNHPADPGGPTNKGVTQRVYDSFRKAMNMPVQSVRMIGDAELQAIYKQRYWDLFKGDSMPAGLGYVVFDGAVNSGVGQSVKWLQRALAPYYNGAIDGLIGQGTLRAIGEHPNHDALIAQILRLRLLFLKVLKTWKTFGRGWTSRIADVLKAGQAWASGTVGPTAVYIDGAQAKALASDAQSPPPKAAGDVVAGGGGMTTVISQAIGQLMPLSTTPTIANIITALTVAGVVVAAGGYAYRFWAKREKDRIEAAIGT